MVAAVVVCGYLGLAPAPCTPSVIQDNFYGAGSVGAVPPVCCPEEKDVSYSGVFNYSEFRRDMKARPLFGGSLLFGVSVKREFTAFKYEMGKPPHPPSCSPTCSEVCDLRVILKYKWGSHLIHPLLPQHIQRSDFNIRNMKWGSHLQS